MGFHRTSSSAAGAGYRLLYTSIVLSAAALDCLSVQSITSRPLRSMDQVSLDSIVRVWPSASGASLLVASITSWLPNQNTSDRSRSPAPPTMPCDPNPWVAALGCVPSFDGCSTVTQVAV
jgi:hypothetical protein